MALSKSTLAAGRDAGLPHGYAWGPDALEHFEFGKRRTLDAMEAADYRRMPWRLAWGVLKLALLLMAAVSIYGSGQVRGHREGVAECLITPVIPNQGMTSTGGGS